MNSRDGILPSALVVAYSVDFKDRSRIYGSLNALKLVGERLLNSEWIIASSPIWNAIRPIAGRTIREAYSNLVRQQVEAGFITEKQIQEGITLYELDETHVLAHDAPRGRIIRKGCRSRSRPSMKTSLATSGKKALEEFICRQTDVSELYSQAEVHGRLQRTAQMQFVRCLYAAGGTRYRVGSVPSRTGRLVDVC